MGALSFFFPQSNGCVINFVFTHGFTPAGIASEVFLAAR
jgi:hypothetical protein